MQYPLLKTPVYDKMIQDFSMTYKEFKDKYVSRRILTQYDRLPIPDNEIIIGPIGKLDTLHEYESELMKKGMPYYIKAAEIVNKLNNQTYIPSSRSGEVLTLTPTKDIFINFKFREILINYFKMMDEKTDEDAWKGGRRKYKKTRKNRS